jgi:hypothetical protein
VLQNTTCVADNDTKQVQKRFDKLQDYPNLNRGGPGRPKGLKDKTTLVREALADAQIKIQRLPQKIRDDCMDIIATEELILNLKTAKKEETKVALIREAFDRSRGKAPVSVSMESRSAQITGTLVDLLGLLKNVSQIPDIAVSSVIECKDSAIEAIDTSASKEQPIDKIKDSEQGTAD